MSKPMSEHHGGGLSIEALLEQLSERDLALLGDLEHLRLASTRHLQRLHFTTATHTTIQAATRACVRVLSRLLALKLVTRLARRIGGVRAGSAGFIWQLGAAGERLLRGLRGEPGRRRYGQPSTLFLRHTLAITELVVRLREDAPRAGVQVETLTEPGCWQPFLGSHARREVLKPDLLVITTSPQYIDHAFVEIDLGTEHQPAIERKANAYHHFAQTGSYQQRHELFPAVVWIVATPARQNALRSALHTAATLDARLFDVLTSEEAPRHLLGGETTEQAQPPPDRAAHGAAPAQHTPQPTT